MRAIRLSVRVLVTEIPSMSGACAIATRMPTPVRKPEQDGTGQEVGQEPEPGQSGQAGDHRHSSDLRVPESHRDAHGGQGDTGNHVRREVRPVQG